MEVLISGNWNLSCATVAEALFCSAIPSQPNFAPASRFLLSLGPRESPQVRISAVSAASPRFNSLEHVVPKPLRTRRGLGSTKGWDDLTAPFAFALLEKCGAAARSTEVTTAESRQNREVAASCGRPGGTQLRWNSLQLQVRSGDKRNDLRTASPSLKPQHALTHDARPVLFRGALVGRISCAAEFLYADF